MTFSSGGAAEIVLPFANLSRGALHLGLEDFVGDPAQEVQGGGHGVLPVAAVPSTMLGTYGLRAKDDVIAITTIRFPCKRLI
jgi:hypothetical protein